MPPSNSNPQEEEEKFFMHTSYSTSGGGGIRKKLTKSTRLRRFPIEDHPDHLDTLSSPPPPPPSSSTTLSTPPSPPPPNNFNENDLAFLESNLLTSNPPPNNYSNNTTLENKEYLGYSSSLLHFGFEQENKIPKVVGGDLGFYGLPREMHDDVGEVGQMTFPVLNEVVEHLVLPYSDGDGEEAPYYNIPRILGNGPSRVEPAISKEEIEPAISREEVEPITDDLKEDQKALPILEKIERDDEDNDEDKSKGFKYFTPYIDDE